MFRALVVASALLFTAACGSGTGNDAAAPSGAVSSGAFPVTVAHKYGSTTVKAEPKRIVLVGVTDQDPLLALGIVPVAVTDWLKKYEGAINPWARHKLNGTPLPTVLTDQNGPQFEKIASLRPDLVVGLSSGLTQEAYDKLSQIAPTVAQPKEYADYTIPWQDAQRTMGKLVGKQAEAEKLVADAEALLAKARQKNPKFANATALVATQWEGYFVYGSQDARGRILTSLGFKLPANLDEVIGNKFGATISKERVDLLDQTALVWLMPNVAEGRAALDRDPLYSSLRVAKEKRDILVNETTDVGSAVSFVSVLSLPVLLDGLVPQLAKAVG